MWYKVEGIPGIYVEDICKLSIKSVANISVTDSAFDD